MFSTKSGEKETTPETKSLIKLIFIVITACLFLAVGYYYFHYYRYTDQFIKARQVHSEIQSGHDYPIKTLIDTATVYLSESKRFDEWSWTPDLSSELYDDAVTIINMAINKGSVDGAILLREVKHNWIDSKAAVNLLRKQEGSQDIMPTKVAAALGELYYEGTTSVIKSDAKAVQYLLIAASTGDPDAYPMLAELSAKYECLADYYAWDLLSQSKGEFRRISERTKAKPSPKELAIGDAKSQIFNRQLESGKNPLYEFQPSCTLNKIGYP